VYCVYIYEQRRKLKSRVDIPNSTTGTPSFRNTTSYLGSALFSSCWILREGQFVSFLVLWVKEVRRYGVGNGGVGLCCPVVLWLCLDVVPVQC